MLQVIQHQNSGEMSVEELPEPQLPEGAVLVNNSFSLISAGTERSMVETAEASLFGKAKKRPDLVKQVIDNVKKEGIISTYKKVQNRLDSYIELGYSSAGIVLESSVSRFHPGDRVACAGAGYAVHAEKVVVPSNLAVQVPEQVDLKAAAFTTVASIALQGVRQADPKLGESVAVIGLGLIGLITVQLLRANGCRVIGMDISDLNFQLAEKIGCDKCLINDSSAIQAIENFTRGYGVDSTIITAATTSNQPVELSLEISRKKGTVVVVGAVGMDIPRSPFYEKELDLRIACSYGPGRYDFNYEEKGNDYPLGYVRWTENRNMEAVLHLMAKEKLDVHPLITHEFHIKNALEAYQLVKGKIKEPHLGILLKYPQHDNRISRIYVEGQKGKTDCSLHPVIGFIGAGNFAQSHLIPHLKSHDIEMRAVATSTPINSKSVAEKFEFSYAATDPEEIFNDSEINTIFIATQHDTHAHYVMDALKAGKNVFVEKPLAISPEELEDIRTTYESTSGKLVVGFNRRFSEPFRFIKSKFRGIEEPLVINYRVNAGYIPPDHWIQDPDQGGRIIGEGCHFIDIFSYLTEERPVSIYATAVQFANRNKQQNDTVNIVIRYSNGSIGNLVYLANGDKSVPKEYCEVYGGNQTAIMDNFNRVYYHAGNSKTKKKFSGDKGHDNEISHFIKLINGKDQNKLNFLSVYDTTLSTYKALESIHTNKVLTFSS